MVFARISFQSLLLAKLHSQFFNLNDVGQYRKNFGNQLIRRFHICIVNEALKKNRRLGLSELLTPQAPVETHSTPKGFVRATDLAKILNINTQSAGRYYNKFEDFRQLPLDLLLERVDILVGENIPLSRIKLSPWILLRPFDELKELVEKRAALLDLDFRCALPLSHISHSQLLLTKKVWRMERNKLKKLDGSDVMNRLEYLADRLQLTSEDVAYMMGRAVLLTRLRIETVNDILGVLQVAGIQSIEVYHDPYIFTSNVPVMTKRLALAKEYGIKEIRPWMLRDREHKFLAYLQNNKRESDLLEEHGNVQGLLQDALACSPDVVQGMFKKQYLARTAKARTIDDKITFLTSKGYSDTEITSCVRVLTFTPTQLRSRLEQIESLGIRQVPLSTLTMRRSHFLDYLDRIKSFREKDASSS